MANRQVKPPELRDRPKKRSLKFYANAVPSDATDSPELAEPSPCAASPVSYAGKWIGWTPDARRIVASGSTPQKVLALAKQAGYPKVILERVPRNLEPIQEKSDS